MRGVRQRSGCKATSTPVPGTDSVLISNPCPQSVGHGPGQQLPQLVSTAGSPALPWTIDQDLHVNRVLQ